MSGPPHRCSLRPGRCSRRTADAETVRVGTPAGANFTFLPARIAADRGAFKAEGLDVEVTDFGGGAKLQQAIVSGAIDMTVSAGTDLAFSVKGSPIWRSPRWATSRRSASSSPMTCRSKTVDDLKGKKVGVTTVARSPNGDEKRLVAQKGWPKMPSRSSRSAAIGRARPRRSPPARSTASSRRRLSACKLPELSKKARILLSGFDIGKDFLGEAIYASNSFIQSNPDAVRRFLKAWFQNIAWMRAHKPETVESRTQIHALRARGRKQGIRSGDADLFAGRKIPSRRDLRHTRRILRRDGHVRSSARSDEILEST